MNSTKNSADLASSKQRVMPHKHVYTTQLGSLNLVPLKKKERKSMSLCTKIIIAQLEKKLQVHILS